VSAPGASEDRLESPRGAVAVGPYVLEIGSPAGTTLGRGAFPADAEAAALAQALAGQQAEPEPEKTAVEAAGDLVDEAAAATAKVERALTIGKGAARGAALDPAQLGLEADALLDLLERLDREGRAKEALRLARTLSKLYSLLRRWADLLRALQAALRAGEVLGDLKAVGWAKHELGTLQLAGGDVEGAERNLTEARKIRQRIGDSSGLVATEHNLLVLSRHPHGPTGRPGRTGWRNLLRTPRLVPALAVGVLVFGAGVAGGAVLGGGGDTGTGGATTITAQGAGHTDTTTVTETGPDGPTATLTVTATVTEAGGRGSTATVTDTETEVQTVTETEVETVTETVKAAAE
jgi:hypothetical protein